MIKVTDYIADYLVKEGIKDIFMISGGGSSPGPGNGNGGSGGRGGGGGI